VRIARFAQFARTDMSDGARPTSHSIDEQALRLLKAFLNIEDPDAREVVITIAKFAESRTRGSSEALDIARIRKYGRR